MNFKNYLALSVLAGSLGVVQAALPATIVIDNYNTPEFNLESTGALNTGSAVAVPGTDTTLTGTVMRTVAIDADGDAANVKNNLARISYSNDDGIKSFTTFSYTFDAQDLSSGTAFSFQLVNTDSATVSYAFSVTDSSDNVSNETGTIPIAPGIFNILFADFTGGASFSAVKAISFTLTAETAGADVSIDAFGINLPEVPEPSTYAAGGFVALLAFAGYRRARK
jgi:hypothetical protein